MVLDRRVTDSQLAELARYLLGNISCVCYAKMFLKIGNIPYQFSIKTLEWLHRLKRVNSKKV